MICHRCNSRIVSRVMEDGMIERACLAGAHLYLTPMEIKERDDYLERRARGERDGLSRREAVTPTWKEAS